MYLVGDHSDATTYAKMDHATGKVIVSVAGTSYTTAAAASWSAGDSVDFWVAFGDGVQATDVQYRVNGGAGAVLSTGSPPTHAAHTPAGAWDLCCNNLSNQFDAHITAINAYRSGTKPAWVA